MAGMEGLGRLFNAIPVVGASSNTGFKMRGQSGVAVFAWVTATGSTSTVTVTQASSYAGSYTALACVKNIYWNTAINGTAVWNKLTYVNGTSPFTSGPLSTFTFSNTGNTLPTALLVCFQVFTSELSDPEDYVMVTNSGGTGATLFVLPYDLVHQRAPANLEILSS
jgi:hypothetical protein